MTDDTLFLNADGIGHDMQCIYAWVSADVGLEDDPVIVETWI
jgi:hypothetical protein